MADSDPDFTHASQAVSLVDEVSGFSASVDSAGAIKVGGAVTANIGTTGALVQSSTTPTIYNVSCPASATEYSQALPANCKRFSIKARSTANNFHLCFASGQSNTVYITVPAGGTYYDDALYQSATLYFRFQGTTNNTMEIVAWT